MRVLFALNKKLILMLLVLIGGATVFSFDAEYYVYEQYEGEIKYGGLIIRCSLKPTSSRNNRGKSGWLFGERRFDADYHMEIEIKNIGSRARLISNNPSATVIGKGISFNCFPVGAGNSQGLRGQSATTLIQPSALLFFRSELIDRAFSENKLSISCAVGDAQFQSSGIVILVTRSEVDSFKSTYLP